MPCYRPQLAHRSTVAGKSGKMPLTFKASEAYTDLPVMVPCGKCIGCKTDKTNEWAARCYHESKLHDQNCFVTLTYDDENLPPGGTLVKEHIQKFIHDLRQKIYPKKIRYYLAGEYGEKLSRPHYHLLLFGFRFPDLELLLRERKPGQELYTSEECRTIWGKGHVTIGNLDISSAKYVAGYTAKKITGEKSLEHYGNRIPEFALMSKRPGIGHDWIIQFRSDVYPKDYFHIQGIRHRPPRYYDSIIEKKNPRTINKVKIQRQAASKENDKGGVQRYYVANVKEVTKRQRERRLYESEQR